jgi:hypothetical protein
VRLGRVLVGVAGAGCEVRKFGANMIRSSLEEAATAASEGSKLIVSGTCEGNSTIAKSLTIVGVPKEQPAVAALKGTGSGTVLTVDASAVVTVRTLTITGGSAAHGGGIHNEGQLALVATTVTGNATSNYGGGILNTGSVTLTDSNVTGTSAAVGSTPKNRR